MVEVGGAMMNLESGLGGIILARNKEGSGAEVDIAR